MRFGISATSWIFPKNLRTRLRPVNVCAAISSLALSNRRARDDSPEGRHPSRPSGQASEPCLLCDSACRRISRLTAAARRRYWRFRVIRPEITDFCFGGTPGQPRTSTLARSGPTTPGPGYARASCALLELNLGAGLLQGGLDLLGLVLGDTFLDRLGRALDQVLGLFQAEP